MQASLIRTVVMDVFARVVERHELADFSLNRALRRHKKLHSRERRLIAESLYAMIRMRRRYEYVLQQALPKYGSISTPDQRHWQFALALTTVSGESPRDASVIADLGYDGARLLHAVLAHEIEWPSDPLERLAVEQSLPDWFARRLTEEYGDAAPAIAAALNERAPLTLRANSLKGTREELVEKLAHERLEGHPTALSPWAVQLSRRENVFGLDAYKAGLFEVQDEGSQLIALATGARRGQKVIDACAGAGGKTLALAAMMENKGLIVACDLSETRLADVKPRAKLAGAFNLAPLVVPEGPEGDKALKQWANRADAVLIDAPCSGTGAWRRNPDARWRTSEEDAAKYSAIQRTILDRYSATVKPGGLLVYATCSLLRDENDDVADAFAASHPEFTAVPLEELPAAALDSLGRLRVRPDTHGTDGFFAVGFRRSK